MPFHPPGHWGSACAQTRGVLLQVVGGLEPVLLWLHIWCESWIEHPVLWLPSFADKLLLITTEQWSIPNYSCTSLCRMGLREDSMPYHLVGLQWADFYDVSSLGLLEYSQLNLPYHCNAIERQKTNSQGSSYLDMSLMIWHTFLPNVWRNSIICLKEWRALLVSVTLRFETLTKLRHVTVWNGIAQYRWD